MSSLDANNLDIPSTPYHNTVEKPEAQEVDRLDVRALSVIEAAMQSAKGLEKAIKRGRGSSSAQRCQEMVDDFWLGLGDLYGLVNAVGNGDASAAAKIPGVLNAIKKSLNYAEVLQGNKGYKKNGAQVMAGYFYETFETLSSGFDQVCDAVRPLSEAMEVEMVRMNVRDQLNSVADYRFNTKGVIKSFGKAAEVAAEPVPAVPVAPSFSPAEETWFDGGTTKLAQTTMQEDKPNAVQSGFFERIKRALGAFGQVSVLSTMALGCGEVVNDSPAPQAGAPVITLSQESMTLNNTPADWGISDTRDVTHAIRSALKAKCPDLDVAALNKAAAPLVHAALMAKKAELTQVVEHQQARDAGNAWLGKVRADEAKYGNTVPSNFDDVLKSEASTRLVGAHGLIADQVTSFALSGLPAYSSYTCPSK